MPALPAPTAKRNAIPSNDPKRLCEIDYLLPPLNWYVSLTRHSNSVSCSVVCSVTLFLKLGRQGTVGEGVDLFVVDPECGSLLLGVLSQSSTSTTVSSCSSPTSSSRPAEISPASVFPMQSLNFSLSIFSFARFLEKSLASESKSGSLKTRGWVTSWKNIC